MSKHITLKYRLKYIEIKDDKVESESESRLVTRRVVARFTKLLEGDKKSEIEEGIEAEGVTMLQTVPRVPMAGVKRRWGGRIVGLQESSPEVTSSAELSSPTRHFHNDTSPAIRNDELQLWDLDLHRGLQNNHHHHNNQHTNPGTTILTPGDASSPTPTTIEGTLTFLNSK